MAEFVLLSLPTIVYLIVQSRGQGRASRFKAALARAGASWGSPAAYGWALLLLPPMVLTGWLAIALVPADLLSTPGVSIARLPSVGAATGGVLRPDREEVFFRGLQGGVLTRRLGPGWGNLLHACMLSVRHLAVLLVAGRVLPLSAV